MIKSNFKEFESLIFREIGEKMHYLGPEKLVAYIIYSENAKNFFKKIDLKKEMERWKDYTNNQEVQFLSNTLTVIQKNIEKTFADYNINNVSAQSLKILVLLSFNTNEENFHNILKNINKEFKSYVDIPMSNKPTIDDIIISNTNQFFKNPITLWDEKSYADKIYEKQKREVDNFPEKIEESYKKVKDFFSYSNFSQHNVNKQVNRKVSYGKGL